MRRIRYQVACSLDGYIAGPQGEYDWIVADPDIDFQAIFDQFDTLLMGRKTFEQVKDQLPAKEIIVCSNTLHQKDHNGITVLSNDLKPPLEKLCAQKGKDIWLFGGGELFRSLLQLGYVDSVEPAIIPVVLGGGVPFLPSPADRCGLQLGGHRVYDKSGIILLSYDIVKN